MERRPVHVVYGGAHLFKAEVCQKLGDVASRTLQEYAPDAGVLAECTGMAADVAARVYPRVVEKLERAPVEDYRIDFEDGYGYRSGAEEDGHASQAAEEAAKAVTGGLAPPFFGIRIKPLDELLKQRALRTLERFLLLFAEQTAGGIPANFVVTLPKITSVDQVKWLVQSLEHAEDVKRTKVHIGIELMMETPQTLRQLPKMVEAADGRATSVHFGPFDYTSSLGITAAYQSLTHPACDFARSQMQVMLAGMGVSLADGPTAVLPIGPHRGDELTEAEKAENRAVVHRAWKLHYDNVRRALASGFYQGWDLHPAQLPMRFAAMYAFFQEGLEDASARLKNFMAAASWATRTGSVFDDAATGQGLLNYFRRALYCGAISEKEIPELAGLSMAELQTNSFAKIMAMRRAANGTR